MGRTLLLEVSTGPDAGLAFALAAGARVVVGRMAPSDALLPGDRAVSRRHFAVSFDGRDARVEDLGSSHGTTLNGRPVDSAALLAGDRIGAGETTIRARVVDLAPAHARPFGPPPIPAPASAAATVAPAVDAPQIADDLVTPAPGAPALDLVLQALRAEVSPLFAILDAARDPMVYLRLHECPERKQALYGEGRPELAFVAPYLVSLPKPSPFLEVLVREGWGRAWGVFLTCDRPFEEVHEHLRKSLIVERPGGRPALFRFYDPRVLRDHLPACTAAEASSLFGPIARFLAEGPTGLVAFRPQPPPEGPGRPDAGDGPGADARLTARTRRS